MRIETTRTSGGGGRGIGQSKATGNVIPFFPGDRPRAETSRPSPQRLISNEAPEARERRLRARAVRREAALRTHTPHVEASGMTHWSVPRPAAPSPTVYASATPAAVCWDAVRATKPNKLTNP